MDQSKDVGVATGAGKHLTVASAASALPQPTVPWVKHVGGLGCPPTGGNSCCPQCPQGNLSKLPAFLVPRFHHLEKTQHLLHGVGRRYLVSVSDSISVIAKITLNYCNSDQEDWYFLALPDLLQLKTRRLLVFPV